MTDSWMEQFETHLQQLEQESERPDVDLTPVVQSTALAIACLWEDARLDFWILDSNACHRLDETGLSLQPTDVADQLRKWPDQPSAWIAPELLLPPSQRSAQPNNPAQLAKPAEGKSFDTADVFVKRHTLANAYQLVVSCCGKQRHGSVTQTEEATAAATTLLASKVAQYLLSATTRTANLQNNLLTFSTRLQSAQTRTELHQIVAQENGLYLPNCRISSLDFDGQTHRLNAVTAVAQVNRQSSQVRLIEALLNHLLSTEQRKERSTQDVPDWITVDTLQKQIDLGNLKRDFVELVEDFRTTGVQQVVAIPIHCGDRHAASVFIESYDSARQTDVPSQDWQDLIQTATARCQNAEQSSRSGIKFNRRTTIAAIAVLAAISFLIPMDFELPVAGQLVALGRRSVFAAESGTVIAVHFTNEQLVNADDELIELSNPELSLRLSELDGEIATTEAAVAAANARRISRTADGSAAEGQILKQALKSLKSERELMQHRIDSLKIKAPFAGIIVRRDAEQNLTRRPLQRGQRIAELIPEKSAWQLELYVPQSHHAYLQQAKDQTNQPLTVRYVINSESQTTYSSTISSIEQFAYSRNGVLVQNAKSKIQLPDSSNAKSGTSVSARIRCGTRSVGFVATRKLIELFQHLKFIWWG